MPKKRKKRKSRKSNYVFDFGIPSMDEIMKNIDRSIPKVKLLDLSTPKIPEIPLDYDVSIEDIFKIISKGVSSISESVKRRKLKKSLPEKVKLVVKTIEEFKPLRSYRNEERYRMELAGWLRAKGFNVNIEVQKGHSRPDIVIDNIAIEVKGPTYKEDLRTIADKCVRYLHYFDQLIVVLFDVNVDEEYYEEWYKGMKRQFPQVVVLKK